MTLAVAAIVALVLAILAVLDWRQANVPQYAVIEAWSAAGALIVAGGASLRTHTTKLLVLAAGAGVLGSLGMLMFFFILGPILDPAFYRADAIALAAASVSFVAIAVTLRETGGAMRSRIDAVVLAFFVGAIVAYLGYFTLIGIALSQHPLEF